MLEVILFRFLTFSDCQKANAYRACRYLLSSRNTSSTCGQQLFQQSLFYVFMILISFQATGNRRKGLIQLRRHLLAMHDVFSGKYFISNQQQGIAASSHHRIQVLSTQRKVASCVISEALFLCFSVPCRHFPLFLEISPNSLFFPFKYSIPTYFLTMIMYSFFFKIKNYDFIITFKSGCWILQEYVIRFIFLLIFFIATVKLWEVYF